MIYVFLANGCEEIEALTPVDILRRAELPVKTVGVGSRQITGSHGITVLCDIQDKDADPKDCEMIVLPGGMPGTLNLERSSIVQSFIDFAHANDKWIGAICAAPSILGHKGLLKERKAVCFPSFEDQLEGAEILEEPVVQDRKIITAKGVGVAVEFGLKLTEALTSPARAAILKDSLQCAR